MHAQEYLDRTAAVEQRVAEIDRGAVARPEELIALKTELSTLAAAKPEIPRPPAPADFERFDRLVAQQQPRSGSIFKG